MYVGRPKTIARRRCHIGVQFSDHAAWHSRGNRTVEDCPTLRSREEYA